MEIRLSKHNVHHIQYHILWIKIESPYSKLWPAKIPKKTFSYELIFYILHIIYLHIKYMIPINIETEYI